jgi:hypothetical protein
MRPQYQPYRGGFRPFPFLFPILFPLIFPIGVGIVAGITKMFFFGSLWFGHHGMHGPVEGYHHPGFYPYPMMWLFPLLFLLLLIPAIFFALRMARGRWAGPWGPGANAYDYRQPEQGQAHQHQGQYYQPSQQAQAERAQAEQPVEPKKQSPYEEPHPRYPEGEPPTKE